MIFSCEPLSGCSGEEGESPPKKSLMDEGWEYMGDIPEGYDPWRSPFPVKGGRGRGRGRGFGRGRGAGPHGPHGLAVSDLVNVDLELEIVQHLQVQ